MQKNNWWIIGLIFILGFTLWQNRFILENKYDAEYLDNFYYHSQWNIPNSVRVMGDGDLYQFTGYRLVMGESPFDINFMVPPLGKYLFGLGVVWFGNPLVVNLSAYIGSLILLFFISLKLIGKRGFYWLPVIILALNPLVIT